MKKTVFRLASVFVAIMMALVLLGPTVVFAEGEEGQQAISTQTNNGHGLGLKISAPGEKEFASKYGVKIGRVLPNAMAIARANAELSEEGQPLLPASLAVPDSKTLTSEKSSNKPGAAAIDGDVPTEAGVYGALPKSVDNSALNYFPAIGDQGYHNSCVAFSTAYYMLTYQNAKVRNLDAKHNPAYVFSPKFTYNLINGGEDYGATFEAAFMTMYATGSITGTQFPYDGNYSAWPTDASVWRNAMKYKTAPVVVNGYNYSYGYIGNLNEDTGIYNMKQKLANGDILSIGIDYFDPGNYMRMLPVRDNSSTSKDNTYVGQAAIAYMNFGGTDYAGHVMTIVGFNDYLWIDGNQNGSRTSDEVGAFKAVNSWGTGWPADEHIPGVTKDTPGTVWISYKAFKRHTTGIGIASYDAAFFINARSTDYVPQLTANVTVTTNDRYDITAFYGANWAEGTEPMQDHAMIYDPEFNFNENHYLNDMLFWQWHWRDDDYPYNVQTSHNLSFQGDGTSRQASFAVDISPYLRYYTQFGTAGGPLDITLGIADVSSGGSQSVNAITFERAGKTISSLEFTDPTTVDGTLKWFYGKAVLNPAAALPVNADLSALPDIPLDAAQPVTSTGPSNATEWKYTPAGTGIYRLSFSGSASNTNIEILNNARQRLYWGMADSGSKIEQRLYAGKTYVIRAYSSSGSSSFNVTLTKLSDQTVAESNCYLGGINSSIGLNETFDKDTLAYTIQLTDTQPTVDISAMPEVSGAPVLVDGATGSKTIAVDTGETKHIEIKVTSKDLLYTKTYTIAITRDPSGDATLSGITAPGSELSPGFISGTHEYTLTIPEFTGSVAITPAKSNSHADMTIDSAAAATKTVTLANGGSQDVTIHLDSQNGAGHEDYLIHVTRAKSNNSLLSGLTVSASKLSPAFNPAATTYTLSLPENTASVTVTPTKAMGVATVTINGNAGAASIELTPDNGQTATATIAVTSQSGTYTTTYTVNAIRAASTNTYLSSLTASNGTFTRDFSRTRTSYILNLPESVGSTTITAIAENHNANVQFVSGSSTVALDYGKSTTVKIKVTSQASTRKYRYYTISVRRPKCSINDLASLTSSAGYMLETFDENNTSYTVNLPENVEGTTITATAEMPLHSKVYYPSKTFKLKNGQTIRYTIKVRSQAGRYKYYTVTITRAKSTNANLSYVRTKPTSYVLDPVFSPDKLAYTVYLPANVSRLTLYAGKQNGYATMLINGRSTTSKTVSVPLNGYVEVKIKITAQDATTIKEYTIRVIRGTFPGA